MLRNDLLKNSEDIINLLKKRRDIAINIGKIKNNNEMVIRNRQREIQVLKLLGDDHFTEIILNILFEFSIHYEYKNKDKKNEYKNKYHSISFEDDDTLIYLLSNIIPPGSIIYSKNHYSIIERFSDKGIHIIDEEIKNPDAFISFKYDNKSDIIIDDKKMLISDKFIINTGNIYSFMIL